MGAVFFVNGFVFSNWIPRINEVRDRLGVSNSGLGLALLGGGLGGFLGSLMVARIVAQVRTRTVVLVASLMMAVLVPLVAVVPNAAVLLLLLTLLGFNDVQNDVAFNAQGVMVQTRIGRPVMQRLHGTWSLGMVAGGGTGWLASAADVDLGVHLVAAAVFMVLVVLLAVPGLLGADDPPEPSAGHDGGATTGIAVRFAVAIGAMGFGLALLEGMPNDWSSVVLTDVFEAGRLKGAGTSVFAAAMLLGRLTGDHVSAAIGGRRMFTIGTWLCVGGSVVLAVAPITALAFVAYAMWGLGVSVLFPQLYEIAARLPGVPAARGLGAMTFGQRLGFLSSAVVVGFLADLTNFRVTLFAVASAAALLVLGARTRTR
ncbi:MAG: inner membrane protein YbjJ [Actinomycetota bacterium]